VRKNILAVAFMAICPLLIAQQALNNDSVIKLVKAGLSEDLIVSTINVQPGAYDTSTDGLIALKAAGASDRVVTAIVAKAALPPPAPAAAPALPAASAPAVPPPAAGPEPSAQEPGKAVGFASISPGVRIVIAPMGGFESFFAAAVREKKVPIILTLDKASAQYFVVSTDTKWQDFVYGYGGAANWNRISGDVDYDSSESSTHGHQASIMLIDAKTKDVVWAYVVHKNSLGSFFSGRLGARGQQSIAEACAKHLKEYIKKGK